MGARHDVRLDMVCALVLWDSVCNGKAVHSNRKGAQGEVNQSSSHGSLQAPKIYIDVRRNLEVNMCSDRW